MHHCEVEGKLYLVLKIYFTYKFEKRGMHLHFTRQSQSL